VPLRLILFDLWGTLFAHEGPGEDHGRGALRVHMAREALGAAGHHFTNHHIQASFARAGDALAAIHGDGRDISAEARTILYVRHVDASLVDKLDDATWARLHDAILTPALHKPPDAMPGALDALRDARSLGVPLGMISNAGVTPGRVLREILDRYALLEHFAHTIFSDEVELAKPSAAIFEHTLELFGVDASDAVFIGDQPLLDVLGPQAAGLWTVQLGDLSSDGIEPHVRIATLGDLLPALRKLNLVA
jgi:putative hydrolase of the HAD superfamily